GDGRSYRATPWNRNLPSPPAAARGSPAEAGRGGGRNARRERPRMKGRIAVLTTGRQDYGILRSTCFALHEDPRFELLLLVAGMHLSDDHGYSVRTVERDDLPIARRIESSRVVAAEESAVTVEEVFRVLEELQPGALILVGDRTETAAAALA